MLSILLTTTSTWLPIPTGTATTLTFECPAFDTQFSDRAWSIPFKLPATPAVLAALGYANRVDIVTLSKHPCQVFISDLPIPIPTQIIILATNPTTIEIAIQSISIPTISNLSTIRLRDIPTTIDVAGTLEATFEFRCIITEADWASALYERFAIIINGVYITAPATTEVEDFATAINAHFPGLATATFDPGELPDIYLYLTLDHAAVDSLTVIERPDRPDAGTSAHFLLISADLGTEATRIAAAWEALLSAGGTTQVRFPVISAPQLYDRRNEDYSGLANYTNPLDAHPTPDIGTPVASTGWAHTILPLCTLGGLFDYLATLGYTITGTWPTSAEARALLLWHNQPADYFLSPELITPARTPTTRYRTYPPQLALAQHLPDITAWELLSRFLTTYLHHFTITPAGHLQLRSTQELLTAAPEDWTHLTQPPAAVSISYPNGYRVDYDRQSDTTDIPTQLQRLTGPPDSLTYTIPFFTLHDLTGPDPLATTRTWLLPYITEAGQSAHFALTTTPTLRLLHYRGITTASDSSTYALAQHGRTSHAGSPTGTYTLALTGTGALIPTWWAAYIALAQHGRTITLSMSLSPHHIIQLLAWTHIRKHITTEEGSFTAAVRSLRIRILPDGTLRSEVTFLKEP